MKKTLLAAGLVMALPLAACGNDAANTTDTTSATSTDASTASTPAPEHASTDPAHAQGHHHHADGGPAPEGIAPAADPAYPVGTAVRLTADHMPGMQGVEATVSGAYSTYAYAVTYAPTPEGTEHKWVVQEEIEGAGITACRTAPRCAWRRIICPAWRGRGPPWTFPRTRRCTWWITGPGTSG